MCGFKHLPKSAVGEGVLVEEEREKSLVRALRAELVAYAHEALDIKRWRFQRRRCIRHGGCHLMRGLYNATGGVRSER
jgi:hypothetical protein